MEPEGGRRHPSGPHHRSPHGAVCSYYCRRRRRYGGDRAYYSRYRRLHAAAGHLTTAVVAGGVTSLGCRGEGCACHGVGGPDAAAAGDDDDGSRLERAPAVVHPDWQQPALAVPLTQRGSQPRRQSSECGPLRRQRPPLSWRAVVPGYRVAAPGGSPKVEVGGGEEGADRSGAAGSRYWAAVR